MNVKKRIVVSSDLKEDREIFEFNRYQDLKFEK